MKRSSLAVFALIACLAFPWSASAHQPSIINQVPIAQNGEGGDATSRIDRTLLSRSGEIKVVIELADTPSLVTYTAERARGTGIQAETQARAQLTRIEQAQRRLLAPLGTLNADVIYRVQRAYNGIAVRVDASKLPAIAALPNVKAVHPLVTKYRQNTGSVPLTGAPTVWGGANGKTGTGIRIAVIDTGIDYIHKDFGGSGNYADVTDTSAPAFTPKVVGGYDFVGDAYNPSDDDPSNDTPKPDANPMDCISDLNAPSVGHGTHVAGTAAGFGVLKNGNTYTGPYNDQIDFTQFKIGPGTAPEALLVALRVFGCDGGTDYADLAIEWAVDPNGDGNPNDHVDVINMSLGSDYGLNYDSTAVASENAAQAGVIVVATSGNSADTNYITGSPGSGDSVISVAGTNQSDVQLDAIRVNAPSSIDGIKPAKFSVAYPWDQKDDVTGAVYYPPTNPTGCTAFTPAETAAIAGKVVLIDWTDDQCGSVARAGRVATAGGIGVIMVDNSESFDLFITGSAVIPAVSMPKRTGDELKANLTGLNVTFSKTLRNSTVVRTPEENDTIYSATSRGPRRGGSLKPDIAAPGQNIFSARWGTGTEGQTLSGTSMAAPHVAGIMALLKQTYPTWSVQELKALVMNTATNDVRSGIAANAQIYGPARVGAGRVDAPNAVAQSVIAFDAQRPNGVSVSFGNVEVVSTTTLTRTVSVVNKGTATATFDLSYTPVTNIPGVVYAISPASVTLAAGATATANVVMSANPALMKHTIDPTMSQTQGGLPRQWVSDASGYLTMTPQTAQRVFTANIRGYYENPPVPSEFSATGVFTFTAATNVLDYSIVFNKPITLNQLGGHIHRGRPGENGPVAVPFPGLASATIDRTNGSVTLTAPDVALLLNGALYANFHTAKAPGGEVRGQIVPSDPTLRLPIYAAARPASAMSGAISSFPNPVGATTTTSATIALTGVGVNTGTSLPTDTVSIVTAFELQEKNPPFVDTPGFTQYADLQYIGISSNFSATRPVSETTLFFGISTHDSWASPNEVYFEIDFDTNKDGAFDYALFTTDTGTTDANDVKLTRLVKIREDGTIDPNFGGTGNPFRDQYPPNILNGSQADTQPFNTNVVMLGVDASDLGLAAGNSTFDYQVFSATDIEDFRNSVSDASSLLRYNVARPGLSFANGLFGLPAYADLPGGVIPFSFNRQSFLANGSEGTLLFHHHNTMGNKVQVLGPSVMALPTINRSR